MNSRAGRGKRESVPIGDQEPPVAWQSICAAIETAGFAASRCGMSIGAPLALQQTRAFR